MPIADFFPLLRTLINHQRQYHSPMPLATLADVLGVDYTRLETLLQACEKAKIPFKITNNHLELLPAYPFWQMNLLRQQCPQWEFFYKPVIGSTNDFLLKNHATLAPFSLCLTEYQTAGRGRRGRVWHSPLAGQLTFSFLWQAEQECQSGLSVVIGIAIAEALRSLDVGEINVKWPNDLLLNGKKLGGILIESATLAESSQRHFIIGIGLNMTQPTLPENTIAQPCVGLQTVAPQLQREQVLTAVLEHIQNALAQFDLQGFNAFLPRWNFLDYFHQKPVVLCQEKTQIHGIVLGLTPTGALRLLDESGQEKIIHQGEVSLRCAEQSRLEF